MVYLVYSYNLIFYYFHRRFNDAPRRIEPTASIANRPAKQKWDGFRRSEPPEKWSDAELHIREQQS